MTLGVAKVPRLANAEGTWTIEEGSFSTQKEFVIDPSLRYNFKADGLRAMYALTFDEASGTAAFRYAKPNGTNTTVSWNAPVFTAGNLKITPPEGFQFFGSYDFVTGLSLDFSTGAVNNSAKTLQWTGALTEQWSFQGDTLSSTTSALEYAIMNQESGVLGFQTLAVPCRRPFLIFPETGLLFRETLRPLLKLFSRPRDCSRTRSRTRPLEPCSCHPLP